MLDVRQVFGRGRRPPATSHGESPPEVPQALIRSDRPDANSDELGRRRFAQVIASQIRRSRSGDGFVISVVGPWGSGKTRVLQMLKEELTEHDEHSPQRIIHFNPWLFSGSDQLTAYFFLALAEALPGQLGPGRGERAAERLRSYGTAVGSIRAVPGLGGIFGAGADVAHEAARRIDTSAADLAGRRAQVESELRDLGTHLIVMIDDVDRLQSDREVQDLMRMVKLVGDLPGVTYVLSFDRRPVVAALGSESISGDEYLEKIVQIEYRLPEPSRPRLAKMLDHELTDATSGIPDDRLDSSRWPEVYERIVRPLVRTPRQVRRVGNAVRLSVDLHGSEVDLVDQLAMATVATVLPAFHDGLPALADDLMPSAGVFADLLRERTPEEPRARLVEAAQGSGEPEVAKTVYSLLFPWTRSVLADKRPSRSLEGNARRLRRICDPETFWTYYNALLPDDGVSIGRLRAVVSSFGDPSRLEAELGTWDDNRLPDLFSRLRDFASEVDPRVVPGAVRTISTYARGRISPVNRVDDPSRQVEWLISDLVERMPAPDRQRFLFEWASEREIAVEKLQVYEVAQYKSGGDEPLAGVDNLEAIRSQLAQTVIETEVDSLLDEYWAGRMIWVASSALAESNLDALRDWLDRSDRLFARYLMVFAEPSFDDGPRPLAWGDVKAQVGADWVTARLARVSEEPLPEDLAEVVETAQRLMRAEAPQPASEETNG